MFAITHRARTLAAALLASAVAVLGLFAAVAPAADAVTGHPAGLVGTQVKLATADLHGYDVAANPAGTAYIGWISSTSGSPNRVVKLCKLPLGATSCVNGIQTIASLGISSASGLRVLVDGNDVVHMIWFHDTDQSINGPNNAAIAEATAVHGLNLTAATDIVTNAPSFGSLLAAEFGPGGTIWTVAYPGGLPQQVRVWHNTANPEVVSTPFKIGYAQLAFTGGTPVMSIEQYGFQSSAARYATRSSGGTWSSFHAVANTSTWGNRAVLKTTRHGLRLVTGVNNASYRPVISKWTHSGFTARQLTADSNSCAPNTHDGWADASGRLLDVSWECNDVTVTNYADAFHAAIYRLHVSDTPTDAPQIASGTRGIATVAYSVQKTGVTGNILRVARIRLPDSTVTVGHSATGGRVTVTGPRSCLPPVNVHIGWTHRPAGGWTFKSGALRLNGKVVSSTTLDGTTLSAGKTNYLAGQAVFVRNGTTAAVKTTLTFTTCAAS